MDVHPSQRRVSCEVCRKNKTKCKRLKPEDSTCIRCASLGVFCDPGQQRKVGRPKGKTSASADTSLTATERRRHATSQRSMKRTGSQLDNQLGLPQYRLPAMNETHQAPSQPHLHEMHISQRSPSSYSALKMPYATNLAFEVPGWPTFMTESWYQNLRPQDAAFFDRGTPHGEINSTIWAASYSRGINIDSDVDPLSTQPSVTGPAMLRDSSRPKQRSKPVRCTTPPSASRQATYYVHGDKFTHRFEETIVDVDISGAMFRLQRMRYDLQLRRTMIEANCRDLSLDLMIYRNGPLYIENNTIAGFLLEKSQDFLQILRGLHHHHVLHNDPMTNHLIPVITEIYCQLLSFYELFIELLTSRVERLSDPMIPIPGFSLDGVAVKGLSAQGALFCNTCLTLLERLNALLETGSDCAQGLLSKVQIEELWDALDEGAGLASDNGIMRPSDIQKLYVQMRAVLDRVSLQPLTASFELAV